MNLVTAVESQADHRAATETTATAEAAAAAAGAEEISRGVGASSGSSSVATAKPGGRWCWVCKSDQHYARDWPKQIYQGRGERGHHVTKFEKTENAVMAVDMRGRPSTDDNSRVCSEAEFETYTTTLEIKTGGCLVSI